MKYALFFPLILLLGLVIGGWAPKGELRAAKREAEDLKQKLANREKDSRVDAFTRMVQIPDRAKTAKPAFKPSAHIEISDRSSGTNSLVGDTAAAATTNAGENITLETSVKTDAPPVSPEDLRARIDEAKELWKTRVEVARAQWVDRLKLSPEATALFDASINAMNEELYNSMQGLANELAANETLTPEIGTRAFNEMTASLVKTYDDLGAIVPEAQRGEASKMELTDFIDPAVAEPLISVQDKLDKIPQQQQQHHGGPFGIRRKP